LEALAWPRRGTLALMLARVLFLIMAVVCAACGDSGTPPSEPPADLSGAWTGQIGTSMSGTAVRLTWTAAQSGSTASGPASLVKPAVGTEIPGTLTATISGNRASLSFSATAGSVPTVPACAASGTGSGTFGGNSVFGTLTLTATGCSSIGIENAPGAALLMTR
jgi:hypothetical protein